MDDMKERLLKHRLGEETVDVPGIGTLRVRGLSHDEVISMRKAADFDASQIDGPRVLVIERHMIAKALLDPELTVDEVAQWQANSPAGEVGAVSEVVKRLSGLEDGADKAAYKSAGG